jgi:hypothetical protein
LSKSMRTDQSRCTSSSDHFSFYHWLRCMLASVTKLAAFS